MTGANSAMITALCEVDPKVPEALRWLDARVVAMRAAHDDIEYSASAGESLSPYRATYYWDAGRRGASVATTVIETFLALTGDAGVPVESPLREALQASLVGSERVLQLVIGIDASTDSAATRFKLYAVFKQDPRQVVDELLRATSSRPPPAADLSAVYILGLDFTAAGLADVKLYFALDPLRVERTLRQPAALRRLLGGCRRTVYQHCLRREEKRALYFHADNPHTLADELARARAGSPCADELARRVEAMNAVIRGPRLDPWILSYRWRDGLVDRARPTLYFHPTGPSA